MSCTVFKRGISLRDEYSYYPIVSIPQPIQESNSTLNHVLTPVKEHCTYKSLWTSVITKFNAYFLSQLNAWQWEMKLLWMKNQNRMWFQILFLVEKSLGKQKLSDRWIAFVSAGWKKHCRKRNILLVNCSDEWPDPWLHTESWPPLSDFPEKIWLAGKPTMDSVKDSG